MPVNRLFDPFFGDRTAREPSPRRGPSYNLSESMTYARWRAGQTGRRQFVKKHPRYGFFLVYCTDEFLDDRWGR